MTGFHSFGEFLIAVRCAQHGVPDARLVRLVETVPPVFTEAELRQLEQMADRLIPEATTT